MKAPNPLLELARLGQSVWIDMISRKILRDGPLDTWIREDGLAGMTSNPAIFEKAIVQSGDYDPAIDAGLARHPDLSALELYERLAIEDIQAAADRLRPVYDEREGADGFVSLEV